MYSESYNRLIYVLLCDTLLRNLWIRPNLILLDALLDLLRSPPRIKIHHELLIRPWHDSNVLLDIERVVELSGWLTSSVFNVPHLGIHPDLHSRIFTIGIVLFAWCTDDRGVGVHDCGCEVEDGAYWDGVLECGGVEGDECRAGVGKGCCGCESEFEGLFEEEAAKDHEVVSVAVLGLHDGRGFELGSIHEVNIVWLTEFAVG
jgi:hypothetical protein